MFIVKKHCENCTDYVIDWPAVADSDGTPTVGLVWSNGSIATPWVFQQEDDADRVAAYLNKAMYEKAPS